MQDSAGRLQRRNSSQSAGNIRIDSLDEYHEKEGFLADGNNLNSLVRCFQSLIKLSHTQ